MECPKCGFVQSDLALECARCGVIFARLHDGVGPPAALGAALPPLAAAGAAAEDLPPLRRLSRTAVRALLQGGALAAAVAAVPFLSFVFSYLATLVHELGHTATAWLFGYPAIPAFDFVYGGGVSLHFDRSATLVALLVLGWGALLVYARRQGSPILPLAVLAVLWAVAAWTPLHELLMVAMGHGAELVFAGLFLFRALGGDERPEPLPAAARRRGGRLRTLAPFVSWDGRGRSPVERALYAFSGGFILFHAAAFAWGLATDPVKRQLYEEAKGGGRWMDFSRLAEDFLGTDVATVATVFLLLTLATPLVTWLLYRYGARWRWALVRKLGKDG